MRCTQLTENMKFHHTPPPLMCMHPFKPTHCTHCRHHMSTVPSSMPALWWCAHYTTRVSPCPLQVHQYAAEMATVPGEAADLQEPSCHVQSFSDMCILMYVETVYMCRICVCLIEQNDKSYHVYNPTYHRSHHIMCVYKYYIEFQRRVYLGMRQCTMYSVYNYMP